MNPIRFFKIWRLKRKARAAYARAQIPHYMNCGRALADHLTNGRLSAAEAEFNEIMDQIRELDPAAPRR